MNDLPGRHHRLKIILASLLLTIFGAALIAIGEQTGPESDAWFGAVPWSELGGILVGAGLLSVWLDYLFRREQAAADDQRLRQILREHAPLMRDAVLEAFAANHDDLARVATPDTLDRIATSSLALRLGDEQFAGEIFADIRGQAIEAQERWHDANVSIDLTPLPGRKPPGEFFDVTVRWEYTTVPRHAQRRFVCLSDRAEYATLATSGGDTSPWFFKPDARFSASQREAFELLRFSVDGAERPIRRATRKDSQIYTADVGADVVAAGERVHVSYVYRTVTRRLGHLLFFDVEQPTRDIEISFDYTGTDIQGLSAIDLVPSLRPTRIERPPDGVPGRTLRVEIDGWTYPRSGVAFVWTLDGQGDTPEKPTVGR